MSSYDQETPPSPRRVAPVTGGARGIGRGCAVGRDARVYEADVADFRRAQEVVDDVVATWGGVVVVDGFQWVL